MRAATLQHVRLGLVRFGAIALLTSTLDAPLALSQSLIVEPTRLDLGAGHVSEVLTGQVRLWNASDERVRLYAVEPSCDSCTEVVFTNGWIEPGESSEVEVHLRCESNTSTKMVHSITVHCSDRARPKFKVVVEGRFEPAVVIPTSRVDLGVVRAGQNLPVEVEVFNWLSEPVRLEPAATVTVGSIQGTQSLLVDARSELGPGMASLKFEFVVPSAVGPIQRTVTWFTGLDSQPTVNVVVMAFVAGGVEVTPRFWVPVPGGLMYPIGLFSRIGHLSEIALAERGQMRCDPIRRLLTARAENVRRQEWLLLRAAEVSDDPSAQWCGSGGDGWALGWQRWCPGRRRARCS